MGTKCSCCTEKPEKIQPQNFYSSMPGSEQQTGKTSERKTSERNQSQSGRGSQKIKLTAHEGQCRASMVVKEGGFSLKNFAATNPGKIEDCYKVSSKVVGEGAFGKVFVATDKSTMQTRAAKSISKAATKEIKKMQEEIEIISRLDHPNIVRLFESFEDKKSVYLVMELCDGGELFERIVGVGSFSETTAAHCVKQMFLALNYLHQNMIVHRDLKPENWLVASKAPVEESALKLIDFGISKRLQPGDVCTSKAGTPSYVAPEVMSGRYNNKVDIWSTGVIMYIMLCGNQPFPGSTVDAILAAVQNAKFSMDGEVWNDISMTAKGLIKALLQKVPSVRPSAAKALTNTWLDGMAEPGDLQDLLSKMDVQNLKKFAEFNKVKKAALTVVATQCSDSKIDALKNLFLSLDANKDGSLSITELKKGLKSVGVKIPKDLARVLEQVDTDGSGVLDYTEFLAATLDRKTYSQEGVVWAAFRKFDLDGSGSIDKAELMKVLGDDEIREEMTLPKDPGAMDKLFSEIDLNGDGKIDFEEFMAMVRGADDAARDSAAVHQNDVTPPASTRSKRSTRSKSPRPERKSSKTPGPSRQPSKSPRPPAH